MAFILLWWIVFPVVGRPTRRSASIMSEEHYNIIVKLVKGTYDVPVVDRSKNDRAAVVKFYRNKHRYTVNERNQLLFDGKVIVKRGEIKHIVNKQYMKNKGIGSRSLYHSLRHRTLISEREINNFLINKATH